MEECGLDSYGSPSEPVVGCCEDRTWEISGLATGLVTSQHGVSSMEIAAHF